MLAIDLTNKRFGRWTVLSRAANTLKGQATWNLLCDCGEIKTLKSIIIRRGLSQSCGCLAREKTIERSTKHGHSMSGKISPTYWSWSGMRQRCGNPKNTAYPRYGALGITVCQEWQSFANFVADMGERPAGTTLDRIDNSLGYAKANCRWADTKTQARNKSNNRPMTLRGETRTLAEWSEALGIHPSTLSYRVIHGMSDEDALTKPVA